MVRLILVVALALAAGPVAAQKKMYRCGNVFQERPCEGPKQGAKDESAKAAAPKQPVSESRRAAQKEIRCENFTRQRDDLLQKKRAIKDAGAAKAMDVQIGAVDERMREDGC